MNTYWVELSLGIDWSNEISDTRTPDGSEETQLSNSQYSRARNVQRGDILLHHVLGVQCWAGYSYIVEPPTPTHDPQTEEDKAYPYSMRISRGTWLNSPDKCFLTCKIPGLSHYSWHRKGYVRVEHKDAELIMKAVDVANGNKTSKADAAFLEKWKVQRDANASAICKQNAGYSCKLCGETDLSWCDKRSISVEALRNSETDLGWFVHAHHIKPVANEGNANLDNLLCVCPNCHRMVQRLGEDALLDLLRERGIKK
jgi:hypothetical protein